MHYCSFHHTTNSCFIHPYYIHSFDNFVGMAVVVLVIGLCHPFLFDFDQLNIPGKTTIGSDMPASFLGSYTDYFSRYNCAGPTGVREDSIIVGA